MDFIATLSFRAVESLPDEPITVTQDVPVTIINRAEYDAFVNGHLGTIHPLYPWLRCIGIILRAAPISSS
jgi:hypothetical protein